MRNLPLANIFAGHFGAKFILKLALCSGLALTDISAQQLEQNHPISSEIKIEYFDWYAEPEIAEPVGIRNYYNRGLLPGESVNFPPQNSSPRKEGEKFIYRLRVCNLSDKEIVSVVWRYEFFNPLTGELMASREFESRKRIKPNRRKTLYAESFSPLMQVLDVKLFQRNKPEPYLESVTIKSLIFREETNNSKSR